jgi:hypothetical protein
VADRRALPEGRDGEQERELLERREIGRELRDQVEDVPPPPGARGHESRVVELLGVPGDGARASHDAALPTVLEERGTGGPPGPELL